MAVKFLCFKSYSGGLLFEKQRKYKSLVWSVFETIAYNFQLATYMWTNLQVVFKKNLSQRSSPVILCLRAIYYFRFYSKFDKRREKQKRQDDEESVEDVDDDEFERALGKVVGFFCSNYPSISCFCKLLIYPFYSLHCIKETDTGICKWKKTGSPSQTLCYYSQRFPLSLM